LNNHFQFYSIFSFFYIYNRINSFKLEELKNEVVILHIEGLNEIKNLFEQLKSSTNLKDVQTYVPYISQLCKKQNMAYSRYKYIIRDFPDAKV